MFFARVFHLGEPLPLSELIPALEHMGVRAIGEHPYRINGRERTVSIHDLELCAGRPIDIAAVAERFEETFVRIWHGTADDDSLNRLVLVGGLEWREVIVLRAYARYMKQTLFGFDQEFISDTLFKHPETARLLMQLFVERFDPEASGDGAALHARDRRTSRSRRAVERRPDPAAIARVDRSDRPHQLLPTDAGWRAERPAVAQARAAASGEHAGAGADERDPRAFARAWKVCTFAPVRSRAAGCAGPTGWKTTAPKCSGWSKRRP